jgi:hypothetical protein
MRTIAERYEKSSDFFVVEHDWGGGALFFRYTDVNSWDEFEQPTFEAQGERGSQDSVLHSRVRYKLL